MTQQKKVFNPLNYHERPPVRTQVNKKSMTIPDQTLSMRQLVQRFAAGQPIDGAKTPFYDEEGYPSKGINPRTLDLVDIQEIAMENEKNILKLRDKAAAEAADAKARQAAKTAEEKEKEQLLKQWKESQLTGKTGTNIP